MGARETGALRSRIEAVVAEEGLSVLSLAWHGPTLEVRLEHADASSPSIDELAAASRVIGACLAPIEDELPPGFVLETSSPGLERPLREPRHYRYAIGREVRVRSATGEVVGTLVAFDEREGGRLVVEHEGERREIALGEVASAETVFAWGATTRRRGDGT
jgi:ribosome maturation factor RimP